MKNYNKTKSGAHGGAVRINRKYLGRIGEKMTIDDVDGACPWIGGDYAIEYTGAIVHIYQVRTVVIS